MTSRELRQLLTDSHVTDCAMRLLGCEIVAPDCRIRIIETEAYGGEDDPNSHAHKGATQRNKVMFETTGHSYVYLNYGVHWLFNVTCRPQGEAGAVLIRAAVPIKGIDKIKQRRPKAKRDSDLLSGPGKIGAAIEVTGEHTFTDLLDRSSSHYIAINSAVTSFRTGPRIGLRDGSDQRKWRFVEDEHSEWASKPRL